MENKERYYAQYLDHYMESFDRTGQANFISFRPIPSMVMIGQLLKILWNFSIRKERTARLNQRRDS